MNSDVEAVPTPPLDKPAFKMLDLIETKLSTKALRVEMECLAAMVVETYMTYALVGHTSPSPWSALQAQMKVIDGEYKELSDAVEQRDTKELRDGVGDLLYTVFGMAYRAGIPMTQDFEQVVRSNLTKFDVNAVEAEKTQEKYAAIGVTTYCQPVRYSSDERPGAVYYVTFVDGDQVGTDGKKYPNHKWLKSTRFVDISLQPLAPHHPLERTSSKYVEGQIDAAKALLQSTTDLPRLFVELIAGTLFLDGPRDEGDVQTMDERALPASLAMLTALFRLSAEEAAPFTLNSVQAQSQAFLAFVQYAGTMRREPSTAFHDIMAARINTCEPNIRSCFMNLRDAIIDDVPRRIKMIEALYNAAAPYYDITYGIDYTAILQEGRDIQNAGNGGKLMDAVKHLYHFLTGV